MSSVLSSASEKWRFLVVVVETQARRTRRVVPGLGVSAHPTFVSG